MNLIPKPRIDDEKWTWHIGLDAEATRILNALYNGEDPGEKVVWYRGETSYNDWAFAHLPVSKGV